MKFLRFLLLLLLILILVLSTHGRAAEPEKSPLSTEQLKVMVLAGVGHIIAAVDSFSVVHGVLPDSVSQILPYLPERFATSIVKGRPLLLDVNEQEHPRSDGLTQRDLMGHFGYCRSDSMYTVIFFGAEGEPLLRVFLIPHVKIPLLPLDGKRLIYD